MKQDKILFEYKPPFFEFYLDEIGTRIVKTWVVVARRYQIWLPNFIGRMLDKKM